MKSILTGLFLLITITCFSQTIKELEHELSTGVELNEQDIAYKLLEIDRLNAKAINYLVEAYGTKNRKDSIAMLFDKLIRENPQSPKPYLLRANERNARFAGHTTTQRINDYKEAIRIDGVNEDAIYLLGSLYYELFVNEFKSDKNKAKLDEYSSNTILYYSKLCKQLERVNETLKYPLIQLANYRGDSNLKQYYENYNKQHYYFPVSDFVDLPDDWKTNFTVNTLRCIYDKSPFYKVTGVEPALGRLKWYDTHLKALEEPVLGKAFPSTIIRFTWLRTFHNPIVIRLERINDAVTLYWKVNDGKGGYEPGKIVVNKKKTMTIREWNDFTASLNALDFWNMPTSGNLMGSDGARWLLEGCEPGKYHVVDRWTGDSIFSNVCLKLVALTGMEIPTDEVY